MNDTIYVAYAGRLELCSYCVPTWRPALAMLQRSETKSHQVVCLSCSARGPLLDDPELAAAQWNKQKPVSLPAPAEPSVHLGIAKALSAIARVKAAAEKHTKSVRLVCQIVVDRDSEDGEKAWHIARCLLPYGAMGVGKSESQERAVAFAMRDQAESILRDIERKS